MHFTQILPGCHRSYLDAKCESTNVDHFDWENWQYVHRLVRWLWYYLMGLQYIYMQDIPKQTNNFDCGVFISQVCLVPNTTDLKHYHSFYCSHSISSIVPLKNLLTLSRWVSLSLPIHLHFPTLNTCICRNTWEYFVKSWWKNYYVDLSCKQSLYVQYHRHRNHGGTGGTCPRMSCNFV